MPLVQKVLTELGENIKLARLRRGLSSELIAERAGISRGCILFFYNFFIIYIAHMHKYSK